MTLKQEEGLNHFMNNLKIDEKSYEILRNKFFLFIIDSLYKQGLISSQEYESLRN